METEKYVLCKSEEHFNQLNRKTLINAYVVGMSMNGVMLC